MIRDRKKVAVHFVFLSIFAIMFAINFFTPMAADDFLYRYSFRDDNLITDATQIFPSMLAHAKEINGRIFAHFFVQLFDLLPSFIFDIVNALFFTVLVFLIYKISGAKEKSNDSILKRALLLLVIFSAMWIFPISFGDSFIWLSGSCNYLWGAVIGLIFMLPYIDLFNQKETKHSIAYKFAFIVFSFFAGGWLENISSAVVFLAVLILIVSKFYHKITPKWYHIIGIVAAFLGFLVMALAPAELHGKIGGFYIWDYVHMFKRALTTLSKFYMLIFSYIILLTCAIIKKIDKDKIILSTIFVLGSLFANFILIFGVFMPARTSTGVVLFLIISNMILFAELFDKMKFVAYSSAVILIISCVYWIFIGGIDVVSTYSKITDNEDYILSSKDEGIMDIIVPEITKETKYSVGFNLNVDDPNDYPNDSIAKYYGIHSILAEESTEMQE